MHSVIADALSARFASSQRPLPVVALRRGLRPNPLSLQAQYGPSIIDDLDSLKDTLSKRRDRTWAGLRQSKARHRQYSSLTPSGSLEKRAQLDPQIDPMTV